MAEVGRKPRVRWKKVALVVAILISPVVLLLTAIIVMLLRNADELFIQPVWIDLKKEAAFYSDQIEIDLEKPELAALRTSRKNGSDAGAVLNDRLPWVQGDRVTRQPVQSAAKNEATTDLAWMAELAHFDTWDVESPAFVDLTVAGYLRLTPDPRAILELARERLRQGARDGDVARARSEVRELARLCLETESLPLARLGLNLLRRADPEHRDQWFDVETALSGSSGLLLAPAIASDAASELTATLARSAPCASINEALQWNLAFRQVLEPQFRGAYDLAEGLLAATQDRCRLTSVRRNWSRRNGAGEIADGPRAFCGAEPRDGFCLLPDFTFVIPIARKLTQSIIASTTFGDPFDGYRPARYQQGDWPRPRDPRTVDDTRTSTD